MDHVIVATILTETAEGTCWEDTAYFNTEAKASAWLNAERQRIVGVASIDAWSVVGENAFELVEGDYTHHAWFRTEPVL